MLHKISFWLLHWLRKGISNATQPRIRLYEDNIDRDVSFYDEINIDKALRSTTSKRVRFLVPLKHREISTNFFKYQYIHMYIPKPFIELYAGLENISAILDVAFIIDKLENSIPKDINIVLSKFADDETVNINTTRDRILYDSVIINLPAKITRKALTGMQHALHSGVLSDVAAAEIRPVFQQLITSLNNIANLPDDAIIEPLNTRGS